MAEFKATSAWPFRANLYPNFDSNRLTKSTSGLSFLPPLPTDAEILAVGEKVGSSASGDTVRPVFRSDAFAANELDCVPPTAIWSATTRETSIFVSRADRPDFNEILGRSFADNMFEPLL